MTSSRLFFVKTYMDILSTYVLNYLHVNAPSLDKLIELILIN